MTNSRFTILVVCLAVLSVLLIAFAFYIAFVPQTWSVNRLTGFSARTAVVNQRAMPNVEEQSLPAALKTNDGVIDSAVEGGDKAAKFADKIPPILKTVTAYSEFDSCHYKNCLMANGQKAMVGYAACPRNIKLGTKIKIDDKELICGDRTAKSIDGRYDIFMGYGEKAYKKALNFGKKELSIIIYEN